MGLNHNLLGSYPVALLELDALCSLPRIAGATRAFVYPELGQAHWFLPAHHHAESNRTPVAPPSAIELELNQPFTCSLRTE